MSETKTIPIPWHMLLLNSFLLGVYITIIGSGGIFALAISEGLDAAFLYLSYTPVIVLFFGLLSFLVIAMTILLHSARWARYLLCLIIFVLVAIPLTPLIFMPHLLFGGGLLAFEKNGFRFQGTGELVFAIIYFFLTFWWMFVWSRGLYRISKEHRPFSSLWKHVQKFANDYKGARSRLEKLIDKLGKRQTLVPEKLKRKFRRSSDGSI